ncbi:Homeobox protein Hox-B7 [Pseudolycoriella hygida]|uniref:Homeobox protein Hox-B7 n=1 Tax=Pseudolycoriella hygida TaxID=35572 RepID=A0A9Q0RYY1_9DIPT|nr:Homeobox protein Hox-B7 [Pseudolycoriella hygida]
MRRSEEYTGEDKRMAMSIHIDIIHTHKPMLKMRKEMFRSTGFSNDDACACMWGKRCTENHKTRRRSPFAGYYNNEVMADDKTLGLDESENRQFQFKFELPAYRREVVEFSHLRRLLTQKGPIKYDPNYAFAAAVNDSCSTQSKNIQDTNESGMQYMAPTQTVKSHSFQNQWPYEVNSMQPFPYQAKQHFGMQTFTPHLINENNLNEVCRTDNLSSDYIDEMLMTPPSTSTSPNEIMNPIDGIFKSVPSSPETDLWIQNGAELEHIQDASKRSRQTYTREQTQELETEFRTSRYLTKRRRIDFSRTLGLTERQIKIWFQNRRMKAKKDQRIDLPGTIDSEENRNIPYFSEYSLTTSMDNLSFVDSQDNGYNNRTDVTFPNMGMPPQFHN